MPRSSEVKISMTETSAFRRLVVFVGQVHDHAEASGDSGLDDLVDELRADLAEIAGDDAPDAPPPAGG